MFGFGRKLKRWVALFIAGVSLTGLVAACGPSDSPQGGGTATEAKPDAEITLVSFAVTKAAHDAIIPLFKEKWQKEHNQNVIFKQSYGGSGSQTRAVIDGLEADVVHLALATDVDKIAEAGLTSPEWATKAPNNGIVSKSVAAIITRNGNPKGIKTWADLTKPGNTFITANPKTSGGARWNFLALWGAKTQTGGTPEQAKEFVAAAYKNVPVLAKDARESTDVFAKQGQGDALLNYENEVILANLNNENLTYIIPDVNISIDNPVAVVDKNVEKHGTQAVAKAFVEFLYTPEAQKEFAKVGFRSVDSGVEKEFASQFPTIKTLFTVQDLGGWSKVNQEFFADGAIFDQIYTK
ncbi:sulfate ABC transporter substrate-binding protein [Thermosynechococcaceae cyanobacterium BACA0444]|uniref:Sulfate ABC transporter substrate-binding protein n=1 Tax=Pseudocalidococcus azoricus BACA0444 TaxID=2918990 RepID=A0AAE4JYL1_9CYAN|nr:sulfate ABC transporter substrate-binding protein [Pseudocalidococcus azoricus]MDS3859827.1 sulfate ABC transporter substrate-binding protein [Pseudocalidococcus azoricus BACA0444]